MALVNRYKDVLRGDGRLVEQHKDAWLLPLPCGEFGGKASVSRMQSGWAVVRPGSATLQLDLAVAVVQKSRMTRFEAFAAELATWDGQEPRIFLLFDKAPIAAQDIFVSVDKRRVRICTNAGARTEDWTTRPPVAKGAAK